MPANLAIPELTDLLQRIDAIRPTSHDHMKELLKIEFGQLEYRIIDHPNTKSAMYVLTLGERHYGLKIEQGDAKVTRDEAHWYSKVPPELRKHFVKAGLMETHAYVLLVWLDGAPTIEELAIVTDTNPTSISAIDAFVDALDQDEQLIGTYDVVPLSYSKEHSFFKDKFLGKVEQSRPYQYLYDLLNAGSVTINGRSFDGPHALIDRVHANEKLLSYLSPDKAGFIHGDLHSDNLLIYENSVYMVDPNGLDHLPIEYDHGRVIWSLTGWNAIVRRHEHSVQSTGPFEYELSVPIREQYSKGMERIREYFREYAARNGLEPEQAYHRAVYSSAMQYMSRADHASVEHEATALHLRGIEQLSDLLDELKEWGVS